MLGYIISNREQINFDITKHQIQSFDILHKTHLNIFVVFDKQLLYKNNIIFNASHRGHIQVLEWFKNSGYNFEYDVYSINYASWKGHIQVLEWFKNSGYKFKYDENAITMASRNENIHILDWFKNSGYEFKYNENAVNSASSIGDIQVLEWFKKSGYKFKYNKHAFKTKYNIIFKFYSYHANIKKVIKWSKPIIFIKTIKYKTKNKYIKGYNKN
jgi:hypothetical protein